MFQTHSISPPQLGGRDGVRSGPREKPEFYQNFVRATLIYCPVDRISVVNHGPPRKKSPSTKTSSEASEGAARDPTPGRFSEVADTVWNKRPPGGGR